MAWGCASAVQMGQTRIEDTLQLFACGRYHMSDIVVQLQLSFIARIVFKKSDRRKVSVGEFVPQTAA